MNSPQATFSIQFVREWRIKRPFIYRYLESQFVDQFFEKGILRLSSFETFSKHKDEERQDTKEGIAVISNVTKDRGGQSIFAVMEQGSDAFVLCGSIMYSSSLATAFGTSSGFRINNTANFGNAISSHISGYRFGCEGNCIYRAKNLLRREMDAVNLDDLKVKPDAKEMDMGKVGDMLSKLTGDDLYFLKQSRYAHQNEYRLLWFGTDVKKPYIDIHCPEAVQFCTRFEDLDGDRC